MSASPKYFQDKQQFDVLVAEVNDEFKKFHGKGDGNVNKAAGRRLRKALMAAKTQVHELRQSVQEGIAASNEG